MPCYVADRAAELSALVGTHGADWLNSALALGRFGRKSDEQLFIPFCYDRAVLYADKAVFDKLGIPLPKKEMTLDQYESLIVSLTQKTESGDLYVGVYMPYYEARTWMMYCRGLGEGPIVGGNLKLSEGANYEALSHMLLTLEYGYARSWKYAAYGSDNATCAMSLAYACNPGQDNRYVLTPGEVEADPGKNADTLLSEGRLVMLPLPTFDGNYCGTANSAATYGFAMAADSRNNAEAEALILYALSGEGQKLLHAAYGGIPVNKTLWDEDFWRVGYLACEGSDHVLTGIESDGPDNLYALLKAGGETQFGDYYHTATRLDTLEWLYFYEEIGNADHTVSHYAKAWLAEFDSEANKLIRARG
jgi:ABC-type glycerol-3-phosphate transport system substrate-binding protein